MRINSFLKKVLILFIMLTLLSSTFVALALPEYPMHYVYAKGKNESGSDKTDRINIPLTYTVKKTNFVVNDMELPDMFDPEDIFIDDDDIIYIADTGNNRIISFHPDGTRKKIYTDVAGDTFSSPRGVFVQSVEKNKKEIYVADSANNRIVKMNEKGELLQMFYKPESEMLSNVENFDPAKVVVGPTGYIYTLVGNEFMAIDNKNEFKGYLGATELEFNIKDFLIRTFATKEQKSKISKRVPPAYNNLFIDHENRFVACSAADTDQIRVINSVGKNIYKPGFYGETHFSEEINTILKPSFVDLTVDKNGIISLIEARTGKIYQYDGEGNILAVFAGLGNNEGYFTAPVSIESDSNGNIYVLDKTRANIQVFAPTEFIELVHNASVQYFEGEYDKSYDMWSDIVKINADYPLARTQLGAINYKRENYKDSLEEYYLADDMDGYSEAWSEYRHNIFRNNFTLIVVLGILIIAVIITIIVLLKKYAGKLKDKALALRIR